MKPELLAPAGSAEAAYAALQYGADAVYAGLPRFSARAEAQNMDVAALRDLVAAAHAMDKPRKVYVAFNTLLRDGERGDALDALEALEAIGPDGLIVQDLGLAETIRRHFPSLPLHASTQLAAHSAEGVIALREAGFCRVVLARECTLAETADIVHRCGVEIEVFVHGALCHSVSGLCLFSAMENGRSGNRGRCAYCCRLQRGTRFPHSMKDLCLAPVFDDLVATGAASLKIEGRMKGALYVACATALYRALLDGERDPARLAQLQGDLQSVFARKWTTLYARGAAAPVRDTMDPLSLGHRGVAIGSVQRVEERGGVKRLVFRTDRPLERHDGLQLKAPAHLAANDGHPFGFAVTDVRSASGAGDGVSVPAGMTCSVSLPPGASPPIATGETVYLAASADVRRRYPLDPPPRADPVAAGLCVDVTAEFGSGYVVACGVVRKIPEIAAGIRLDCDTSPARDAARAADNAQAAFAKLGGTDWAPGDFALNNPCGLFVPASVLNDARRRLVEALDSAAAAYRARRRAAIAAEESAAAPECVRPEGVVTLKFRIDQTPPEALPRASRVVLAIGHHSPAYLLERLAVWRASLAGASIALALPPLCRDRASVELDSAIRALVEAGCGDWEAADFSGIHRLRRLGVTRFTVDGTTLPAHNAAAARTLFALGCSSIGASPEQRAEDVAALCAAFPGRYEVLARQRPPLFIAFTEPSGGSGAVRRFPGRPPVVSYALPGGDGVWVTVADKPPFTAEPLQTGSPVRLDYSWDEP